MPCDKNAPYIKTGSKTENTKLQSLNQAVPFEKKKNIKKKFKVGKAIQNSATHLPGRLELGMWSLISAESAIITSSAILTCRIKSNHNNEKHINQKIHKKTFNHLLSYLMILPWKELQERVPSYWKCSPPISKQKVTQVWGKDRADIPVTQTWFVIS